MAKPLRVILRAKAYWLVQKLTKENIRNFGLLIEMEGCRCVCPCHAFCDPDRTQFDETRDCLFCACP